MIREHCLLRILLCAVFGIVAQHLGAVEITGKVISVNGNTLAAKMEGELTPNAGDKAEIFFKLAGTDEDISVATAKVEKVTGDEVQLKVDNATGEVAKDQLVRITSEKTTAKTAAAAAASAPESAGTPAVATATPGPAQLAAPLLGRWTREAKNDEPFAALIFKSDGTVLSPPPKKAAAEAHGMMVKGKFVVLESTPKLKFEMKEFEPTTPPNVSEEEEKQFREKQATDEGKKVMKALRELLFFGEIETPSTIWIDGVASGTAASPRVRGPEALVFTKAPVTGIGSTSSTPSPASSNATAPSPPPVSLPSSTAPPRRGKLVVEDNFDNPKDPLQIEGNKNVNGERLIIANAGAYRGRTYNNLPRDFYARCSVRAAQSDPNCLAALVFHTLEKNGITVAFDGVKFVPGGLGFLSSRDNQPGPLQSIPLPSGAYTDATRSTVVGLEVIGDDVRVFIDDKCVANFRIDRPSEGRGFMLATHSTGGSPCTYYFDNVRIFAAPSAAQTSGEKKAKLKPRKR